jgi:predicted nucleic acid-binding protein
MSAFVVDASVVIKWFDPDVHTDAAQRLLGLSHEYVAPDLLFAETAKTVWKKIKRGELSAERGQQLVEDIARVAVEAFPCRVLAEAAHALANVTGRTVYDAMYLALAIRLKTKMTQRTSASSRRSQLFRWPQHTSRSFRRSQSSPY